jgi:hypothetical protein
LEVFENEKSKRLVPNHDAGCRIGLGARAVCLAGVRARFNSPPYAKSN